jgi:hypothetical protein
MPQPQSDYAPAVDAHREMTEMIFGFSRPRSTAWFTKTKPHEHGGCGSARSEFDHVFTPGVFPLQQTHRHSIVGPEFVVAVER